MPRRAHGPGSVAERGTAGGGPAGRRASAPFARHPSLEVSDERFAAAFAEFAERLRDNYPFFHPRYAGQMLKPPHPAAVAGYLAAMLINPNNHALDGGPATAAMEKEAVAQLAAMFGCEHLGHLTSSGTIANLEALYVARELHPGRGIAYSAEAHYTHGRMCGVLGVPGTASPWTPAGRIDLGALDALLAGGGIGTVVATAGPPASAPSTRWTRCSRWPGATGCGCTWTPPTAASSPCSPGRRPGRARPGAVAGHRASATRSSSTRTSTGCSPTAAGRCCSPTRGRAGSTRTTRRTPTSPRTSCTSARSAWSARGPGAAAAALWLTFRLLPPTAGRARPGARGRAPGRPGVGARLRGVGAAGAVPAARAGHRLLLPGRRPPRAPVGHRRGLGADAGRRA